MTKPTDDKYLNNLIELSEAFEKGMNNYRIMLEKQQSLFQGSDMSELANRWWEDMAKNPNTFISQQLDLMTDYAKIYGNVLGRFMGQESSPIYSTDPRDRRFSDKAWEENLVFDFIKQSYVATAKWFHTRVNEKLANESPDNAKIIEFCSRQYIDALSPSNFAFTNPTVIQETIESRGQNLVNGLKNLIADLESGKDGFAIKTTDMSYFKLGENLACSKGNVIFKNDMLELLQYEPTCENVYKTPLLLVPAWINKFYIFDLSEKNSFVKWLTEQGYQVFVVSWINPNAEHAAVEFNDYIENGILQAVEQVTNYCGTDSVNAVGYCLGGTALASTLALMAKNSDNRIHSASFLTTMLDFSDVGDMSVFINEKELKRINNYMSKTGYLSGTEMANIFSILRSNDLIWSFVVNNYLMGKEPFPFDILYWNSDPTRLAAAAHKFYLEEMYLKNNLKKPNNISFGGKGIDLTKVTNPCYLLATHEDHIAPWHSCFESTKILQGDLTFVLGNSGHVSGVINPPVKNKYGYYTHNDLTKNHQQWLEAAQKHEGSWWEHWNKWQANLSGPKVAAKTCPKAKSLGPAPGTYVFEK